MWVLCPLPVFDHVSETSEDVYLEGNRGFHERQAFSLHNADALEVLNHPLEPGEAEIISCHQQMAGM